jgi:hypothetical protein
MAKDRTGPAQELRATIDRLPRWIRQRVLAGLGRAPILAGADLDGFGGACPMLAAEVDWEEVDRATIVRAQAVAWAWDRYAQATSSWRRATERQLLALRAMLEASLLAEGEQSAGEADLPAAASFAPADPADPPAPAAPMRIRAPAPGRVHRHPARPRARPDSCSREPLARASGSRLARHR